MDKVKLLSQARVIVNPVAGAGRTAKKWPQIMSLLKGIGLHFEHDITEAPGHAIELAKSAVGKGYRLVVSVGGDGTINEIVNGLHDAGSMADVMLGIISTGTGSDYIRSLGIPRACEEACQPKAVDFNQKATERELEIGTIVMATGYEAFDPHLKPEYGYGIYPNVITSLELERLASPSGPTGGKIEINGQEPKNVVFIHCVGSRDKSVGHEYCSQICCTNTAKQAHYVKERIPDAKVTVCYIDARAFGKGHEEFYERVQKEGVLYRRGNVSEIYQHGDRLIVRAEDTLLGEFYEEEADLVVLAIGLVPRKEAPDLAKMLRISLDTDGFFLEAHPKLGPVETTTDGVALAGCCQGPKDITDTVVQGRAAAAKTSIPLFCGKLRKEPLVPWIDAEICRGCRLCEQVCEFGALVFDERRKVMTINELLCRGCGACSVACPSGANQVKNLSKKCLLETVTVLT